MISIIIPVYNTAKYLDQCIQSVVEQDYTDWECILVNDGSTDDSGLICNNWAKDDDRIKVIHQENQGVSAARNHGVKESQGEYICFIDSDDWVESNYLLELFNHREAAELAVSGLVGEFPDGRTEKVVPLQWGTFEIGKGGTEFFAHLNKASLLYGPVNKLYVTDIVKSNNIRFPEDCAYGEDLIFNFQYLEYVNKISMIPLATYHYMHVASVLSVKKRLDQFENDYKLWKIRYDFFVKKGMFTHSAQVVLYTYLWGQIYNGIFLFKDIPNGRYEYLQRILEIPEIAQLKGFSDLFACPSWIKFAILHRLPYIFYLYFKLF